MSLAELEQHFSLEGINKSPSIFDEVKMKWLSGEYIKAMTDEEFLKLAMPFIEQSKIFNKGYDYHKVARLLKTRIEILSEIPEKINFLEEFCEFDLSLYEHKKMKTDKEIAKIVLPEAKKVFEALSDYSHDILYPELLELCQQLNLKNGQVLWCIRIAITGQASTPGGATEMADILGREKILKRLDFSINLLNR
jgi:glutamyl-tRNA synthetase